ncbi:winged helix-turn-helix domain-containing protein [Levilactobacillus brevis]|uniref:winged helix-turn-helix domain-containing protein n=1 Tax=Levilactobacillus brevis TaxID=1580 RepID=UPI001BDE68EB|nr:winged helix-turn-helix domain-containing protein [Levilactobacillus brevis]
MIDYLTLKHSDDGMPTWDAYLGPVLQTVGSKNLWRRRELVTAVIEYVNLPNNLKERRYTSNGGGLIAENRVLFAISDLKIAKLIVTWPEVLTSIQ